VVFSKSRTVFSAWQVGSPPHGCPKSRVNHHWQPQGTLVAQGSHSPTTTQGVWHCEQAALGLESEPQAYLQHSQMWQPVAAAKNIPNRDKTNSLFIIIVGLFKIGDYFPLV
jgi:hypothetical protein